VTLILGVGFLFKYAVDNDWIGPAGRVALGVAAGFATLGAGETLWRKMQRVFAQGITALGISVLYLSFYAVYGFYQLAAVEVSFAAMALTTALAGLLSIRYGSLAVALLAQLGGFATPLVLSTGRDAPWALFPYLALLSAGAVWLGRRQGWAPPPFVAAIGSWTIYFAWLQERFNVEKRAPATFLPLSLYALFAASGSAILANATQVAVPLSLAIVHERHSAVFLGLLLLVSAAGLALRLPLAAQAGFWLAYGIQAPPSPGANEMVMRFAAITAGFAMNLGWVHWRILKGGEPAGRTYLVSLALNAVSYLAAGCILLYSGYQGWMGLFTVAVAAAFAASGWLLRAKGETNGALTSAVIAISFLTLAAPVQLDAWRITLAWAVEAAALSFIARRLQSRPTYWLAGLVLALTALRLLAIDAQAPADATILNARFFVLAFSAAAFWFSAWCHPRGPRAGAIYLAGHVTLLGALQLEHAGHVYRSFPGDAYSYAVVGASVITAAYGLALVGWGVVQRSRFDRLLGLAALLLVVLKLYGFDVWVLGRLFRTTAFVALGLLLVGASYLYSRYRSRLAEFLS
jgi:hypothetical protein